MPLVDTNTNPVPFHISMCWYLTVLTGENLQVFQSDPARFQQPLDKILSRIDFRKILVSVAHWFMSSVICGFGKSIRKQRYYTSLNVVVHYFFYRVYNNLGTSGGGGGGGGVQRNFFFTWVIQRTIAILTPVKMTISMLRCCHISPDSVNGRRTDRKSTKNVYWVVKVVSVAMKVIAECVRSA